MNPENWRIRLAFEQPVSLDLAELDEVPFKLAITLDELADEYQLTRFTVFCFDQFFRTDHSFIHNPDAAARWFPCRDGLVALNDLACLIAGNAVAARKFAKPASVIETLRAYVRILVQLAPRGVRFRLECVPIEADLPTAAT